MTSKKNKKCIKAVSAAAVVVFFVLTSVVYECAADAGKWDNAAYINESFRERLLDEECPFDDTVFGTRSYKIYNYYNNTINNSDSPMDCTYYSYMQEHNETNLFSGSVYGYCEIGDDRKLFRAGYYTESEFVMYLTDNKYESFNLCSKSAFLFELANFDANYYSDSSKNVNDKPEGITSTYNICEAKSILDDTDYTYATMSCSSGYGSTSQKIYFYNLPCKVFDSAENAVSYLYTGDETGLLYSPEPPASYDSGLYLENFKMTVHDSNVYSKYYLSFSYTIPDSVLQNYDVDKLQLRIDNYCQWEATETYKGSIAGLNGSKENILSTESSQIDYISLIDNPAGFILYLDDLSSVYELIYNNGKIHASTDTSKRYLLGNGQKFSIDGVDITSDTIGVSYENGLIEVTKSRLSLNIFLEYSDSVMGHEYNGSVDFLDGNNSWMESYTPDLSGNYEYNNDYATGGHYYTEVGTDASGNPTYGYYYYPPGGMPYEVDASGNKVNVSVGGNNITQTVTVPDTINVNVNQGGSGSGVIIEDDDMSFSSLAEVIKSGFGLIDDVDTGVKGDGYPAMLAYLYQGLPPDFIKILSLGFSTVTGIAIILRLLNR